MAEGGEEIPMEGTFPPGSHGGDDKDTDELMLPGGENESSEAHSKSRGKYYASPFDIPGYNGTSTNKQGKNEETSFISGNPSERVFVGKRREMEELAKDIRDVFPNIKEELIPKIRRDEYNQLVLNLGNKKSVDHIIAFDGRPNDSINLSKFPKKLREKLGNTNLQINQENQEKLEKLRKDQVEIEQKRYELREKLANNDEKIKDAIRREDALRDVIEGHKEGTKNALTQGDKDYYTNASEKAKVAYRQVAKEKKDLIGERVELEREAENNDELLKNKQDQVESVIERVNQRLLSLRDRVKEIFKKHGFTVVAVATAIGTVIGVIVSNLKAGLTKVAKGVGNGLKELGAKLGQILPGMVGAIASFIFKTAGEAIGFLAKNAWLLIVGLVVLAVEQFKKRSR